MFSLTKSRLTGLILIALGLVLFFRAWLFGLHDAPINDLLQSLLDAMLFWGGVMLAWNLFRTLLEFHWYRTEDGQRTQYKTVEEEPPLPKKMSDWEEELYDLEFTPFGVFSTSTASQSTEQQVFCWTYIDSSRTIIAEILDVKLYQFLVFATRFEDEFQLEVSYQNKENVNVDTPDIFTVNMRSSISEAYQYHLHKLDEFQIQHGQALQHSTLDAFLPTVKQSKKHMQGIFWRRFHDHLKYTLVYGTIVFASICGMLSSNLLGVWIAAGITALILGVPMVVFDYEKIKSRFRPIDENRVRKSKAKAG